MPEGLVEGMTTFPKKPDGVFETSFSFLPPFRQYFRRTVLHPRRCSLSSGAAAVPVCAADKRLAAQAVACVSREAMANGPPNFHVGATAGNRGLVPAAPLALLLLLLLHTS